MSNSAKLFMRDLAATSVGDFYGALMQRMRKLVQPAFDTQGEQIKRLRERIAEVEEKQIAFRGTWQRGESYRKCDLIMRNGHAFVATGSNCNHDPMKQCDDRAWRMVVQGRPARASKFGAGFVTYEGGEGMGIVEKFSVERERHFKDPNAFDASMFYRAERTWLYELIGAMEGRIAALEARSEAAD